MPKENLKLWKTNLLNTKLILREVSVTVQIATTAGQCMLLLAVQCNGVRVVLVSVGVK